MNDVETIPLPEDVRRLLEAPNYVHLSTLRADGTPRNWIVWVGVEGDRILVCTGSHCRRRLARSAGMAEALAGLGVEVERVGCQKVCKGPVLGVRVDGEWQWFRRMDSRKALAALRELIEAGKLEKRLRKRRDPRRAGKRRA